MKVCIKIILLLLVPALARGQRHLPDSTLLALKNATNDSLRYVAKMQAYNYFEETNRDSALYYQNQVLLLVQKDNKKLLVARSLACIGYQLTAMGRYAEALENLLSAFSIAEDPKNASNSWFIKAQSTPEKSRLLMLALIHHMFAILMDRTENTEQLIFHFKEAKRIARQINNTGRIMLADMNLGSAYLNLNKLDSAFYFETEARDLALKTGQKKYLGYILGCFSDIALKKGDKIKAKQFCYEGMKSATEQNNTASQIWNYNKLANIYLAEGQKDSTLYFSIKLLEALKSIGSTTSQRISIGMAYESMYNSYKLRKQQDSALKYAGLALVTSENLNKIRIANLAQFQNISFKEQLRLQVLEKEKIQIQDKIRTYVLLAGAGVFLIIALILYRNNLHKHKANKRLESTLTNLKNTQTQLIQSEKMASLGELTAGIAHEIQNPLNFVNNFSEVSAELIDEMTGELDKGDIEEVKAIAGDIKDNLEKIRHHGKRADGIVKGMLQHSRTSSGQKEPTDVNALADEYFRLSYHGLRAKDKSFNAELVTKFDKTLPKIDVVPQDIGRVMLNLINNAFYATQQTQKIAGPDYKPAIEVSTAKENGSLLIKVKDNGNGIPDAIKDKIMQPFFTTKPTGEGTGLGLSLSYDIIVKSHGGNILINSTEGNGSEFIVNLPLKS